MKRSLKVIIGFVLASALAGCQTTFYEAGTTPITLSPTVVAAFEQYKQTDYPLFFAVSTNGRGYGYYTCPSIYCDADYSGQAISLCERRSGGVDCKIFAYDRGIVWKGPITYPGTRPDNIGVKGDAEPPKPQPGTSRPRSDIKEILRAKGLSDLEAFQEAKNYIGTKCLDNFERHEKRHEERYASGLETAFAYARDRMGGPYACGSGYSMIGENAKYNALYYCEKGREKHVITAPCEILAIGNKIVWEGKTVRSK